MTKNIQARSKGERILFGVCFVLFSLYALTLIFPFAWCFISSFKKSIVSNLWGEPLSGVDVEGMSLLMDMLDEIRKKFDLSILMTTHDFTMLEQYCDQVVLLQGKILRRGTPLDVLNSEEFAQAFHMGGGAQA